MRFIDFFAGIGGFRMGLELAGHKCVGYCEIDKHARRSYEAIYETKDEWTATDIRTVSADELPEAELWCGGFPCQSFSVAGKRRGFQDTRGTLIYEIFRLAAERKPQMLLLENVKGLLNHDKGRTFGTILYSLGQLGYDAEWQLLNTKNFGPPQNRERVFIIGYLRNGSRREIFPVRGKSTGFIKRVQSDISGKGYRSQQDRVYMTDGIMGCIPSSRTENKVKIVLPVLTPNRIKKRQNGRRMKNPDEPMFTLTGQDIHGVAIAEATKKGYDIAYPGDSINLAMPNSKTRRGRVGEGIANTLDTSCRQGVLIAKGKIQRKQEIASCLNASYRKGILCNQGNTGVMINFRIRRLTPLECWRLQGFPDWSHYKAKNSGVSETQLYKQAGNGVSVPVVERIGDKIYFVNVELS